MKYFYDKNINNHDSKEYIEEFINHINNYDSNSEEKIYDNDDFNDIIINIINSKKKL